MTKFPEEILGCYKICVLELLQCCLVFYITENRLNKLQGSNKKKITSKDIISALSEARDDHMRDFTSAGNSYTQQTPSLATNDPWNTQSVTESQFTGHQSDPGFTELEFEHFEENSEPPGHSMWCYGCCGRQRLRYSAGERVQARFGSSLTPEEERAYLVDCDELELQSQEDR